MALNWGIVLKKHFILLGITSILLFAVFFNSTDKVIAEGDLLGPDVTEVSPQPGGTLATSSPQVISFRVSDSAGVDAAIEVKVDGQNLQPTVVWGVPPETGNDTVSDSVYSSAEDRTTGVVTASFPKLSAGQHTIYIKSTDSFGNVTENNFEFTLVDDEAPKIKNCYPPDGSVIRFATPIIAVKLTDASKIAAESVYLYIDGNRVKPTVNQIFSTVRFPADSLSNGRHYIQLSISDESGNNLVSEWNFIVNTQDQTEAVAQNSDPVTTTLSFFGDPTAVSYASLESYTVTESLSMATADVSSPEVTDLFPAPGSETEQTSPLFSLRFSDPDKLSTTVVIKVDNQAVTPTITWDGIYETMYDSCTGQPYDVRVGDDYTKGTITAQFPLLTSGQHNIYYNLKDLLGNTIEEGYSFTVLTDTGSPEITEKSPADGMVISNPKPEIKARIIDSSPIDTASVKMKLNGSPVLATFNPITSYVSYTASEPLKNGSYSVEVTAADIFGNAVSSVWSFVIHDITPPLIYNFTPIRDSTVNTTTPLIEASIADDSGITNPVYIEIDGVNFQAEYKPLTGRVSYVPTTPLGQGPHNVNLYVFDFQGNKATASTSFKIDTVGPAVSELSPAADATVSSIRPQFSLKFNDPSDVYSNNVYLKVDNQIITVAVTWEGIYEAREDEGEIYYVRIGTDYTKGTVTAQLPQLSQGQHTIYYSLKDKVGNISQKTYTFIVSDTEGPKAIEKTPSDGTLVADAKPLIKAKLDDANTIITNSISFTLNDIPVVFTYDEKTRIISYQPVTPLTIGQNNVRITATDELGKVGVNNWSFTISDTFAPEISNLSPPPMMGVRVKRPTISAKVYDHEGLDSGRFTITLDGTQLMTSFAAETPGSLTAGTVFATPVADLVYGSHTVQLTAFDLTGNRQQKTWQFGVDLFTGMVNNLGDCAACHNEGITSLEQRHVKSPQNCLACHLIPEVYAKQTVYHYSNECLECHFEHTISSPPPIGLYSCTTCHKSDYQETIPVHGNPDELNLHNYSAVDQSCLKCHLSNLTEEHNVFRDNGVTYDCTTCHLSSDSNVKKAIEANNTACSACHGTQTNHEAQHTSGIDPSCTKCHSDNLVGDHMTDRPELGLSCKNCHPDTYPSATVAGSVYDQNRMLCSRCHSDGHGLKLTPAVPSDIPLYPGIEWSQPIDSTIFNEPWMPDEFSTGSKLLISQRDAALSGAGVWTFYKDKLSSSGWKLDSSAPADVNFFNVMFSKDSRKVRISFYGGENHNASPVVGYRIEILYK